LWTRHAFTGRWPSESGRVVEVAGEAGDGGAVVGDGVEGGSGTVAVGGDPEADVVGVNPGEDVALGGMPNVTDGGVTASGGEAAKRAVRVPPVEASGPFREAGDGTVALGVGVEDHWPPPAGSPAPNGTAGLGSSAAAGGTSTGANGSGR
jgi:hypothetical protein